MPTPKTGPFPAPGRRPFGSVRLSGPIPAAPPPTTGRLLPPDGRPGPRARLPLLDLRALRRAERR